MASRFFPAKPGDLHILLDQARATQEDVYIFTADQKRPIEDAERRACIVISTYSMLGFTGRRGGDTAFLGGMTISDSTKTIYIYEYLTMHQVYRFHTVLSQLNLVTCCTA